MDPTLLNTLNSQPPIFHFLYKFRIASTTAAIMMGFGISIAILGGGCQTTQGWNQGQLPVPPLRLDPSTLENVRFQSPGSGGRGLGGGGGSSSRPDDPVGPTAEKPTSNILPDFEQIVETGAVGTPEIVKDVLISGNTSLATHRLQTVIRTRPGRYFDPDKLQQDVNSLWSLPEISRVKGPFIDRQADGVVIRIEIVERNRVSKIEFIGNRGISDKKLISESGLEAGKPIDIHKIRSAKTKVEEFYRTRGYPRTQVEVLDGSNETEVTFLIHEDQQQRIWRVDFEGNTIASEARLRHIVKSKPGILKLIGGLAQRSEIEQDVDRLVTYYRTLGYFNAQIGREITESNDGRYLNIRFIINEGPRYKVRNVSFVGNEAYEETELKKLLELQPKEEMPEFNSAVLNEDLVKLRDLYGSQGYVYSNIDVETRFLEEPGLLDLVYRVNEGKRYRVGQINIEYVGGNSITKRQVVLNRLSLKPGDYIDRRKLESSKRRLAASQIFAIGQGGPAPEIVVKTPEIQRLERLAELDNSPSISSGGGSGSRQTARPQSYQAPRGGGSGFR